MPKGYIIFEANGDTRRISDSLREFLLDEFPDRSLSSAFDILGFEDWRAFPSSLRGDSLPNRFFGEERGPIYEGSCSKFDDIADLCIADLEWACEEGESDLQFFTTISHELRAPLNGIIGFASLMEQTELNEEQRTILQKLQTSNFLLKGLINDLLEFSRVRSAKIELVEEEVDLELFLSELIGLFSERAKSRGIELVIDLNCEKAMRPFFPKLRVAQILTNLVSNAVKFTDSGRVVVRARLEASALVFEVEDTGMGISAHDEKMIFEPFRQAKTSGFKRNEGSGLGLAISKRLARLMSGDLKYAKSITGGSLFQFRMPMVEAERVGQEVVDESKTATEVSGVARSGKRILVVEDNQLNADIISHFLRDYGFEFEVVDDGRKAINAYEDGKYDLILMDIMLPEVNGYEATEAILKKKADKVALPIVGVTAKVFRDDRQRCLDSGMVEVIHKPVDFDLLRSTLDRFLFSSESREGMEAYLFESNPNVSNAPMKKSGVVELRILSEYLDRMGAESGKKAVIDKYLISVSGMLNELQESADREDHSEFERLAHSIKGSAGLVGAWDLQDMAKGAEMAASASGDSFRPGHWVTLVRESFKLVERKIYSFSPSDFDVS